MNSSEAEALAKQLVRPLHALKSDAEYHENSFAIAQTKLALDIIESTLLLHRIDADQTQLELEPIHIGDVLNKVLDSLREYFSEQTIEYEVEFHKGVPMIAADRTLVEHAVKMLLYGTQMINTQGAVMRLRAYRDKERNVKLSLTAIGLDNKNIVLHLDKRAQSPLISPIDTSRSLFAIIGGKVHKTNATNTKGFSVTLPASEQLQLV